MSPSYPERSHQGAPIHSYVIRVSRTPADTGWEILVPGLDSAVAPAIPDAVREALVRLTERNRRLDARPARVFVTIEIEPGKIADVINGQTT